jgi:TolA-binding protein
MLGRRFLLLVAVLMGLTALAASVAPRDPALRSGEEERRRASPTASPAAEPATPTTTIERTISADQERPQRVKATQGDIVELRIESSQVDSVEVLGQIEALDPNSPAVFDILADRPGEHPITLVDSGRRIGTLDVRGSS